MIVQCDSGHLNSDLIACARYRVCDEAIRAKAKNRIQSRDDITHILFVICLPQQEVNSQFVGFQGDPWISVHIDDLRPTSAATVIPELALNSSISQLFIGQLNTIYSGHDDQIMQLETEHKDVDNEVLLSASFNQHGNSNSPSILGEETTVDESYKMDTEGEQSRLFTVPEPVYKDSAHSGEASEMVMEVEDIEDKQFSDPSLGTVALLETMDIEEHLSDTSQSGYNDMEVVGMSVPQASEDPVQKVVDKMPTLGSCEVEKVLNQDDELWGTQFRRASTAFNPQHHRLLGCVQAAVSILKDSQRDRAMHRIHLLMALIPKSQEQLLGNQHFLTNCF